nr:MAG TPA: hypothetical protein [Caudoviricetes sp.]
MVSRAFSSFSRRTRQLSTIVLCLLISISTAFFLSFSVRMTVSLL